MTVVVSFFGRRHCCVPSAGSPTVHKERVVPCFESDRGSEAIATAGSGAPFGSARSRRRASHPRLEYLTPDGPTDNVRYPMTTISATAQTNDTVPSPTVSLPEMAQLEALLADSAKSDKLLTRVVERLRNEQNASADEFFKHGQFGSHKSG
jgi:hypothetical protein